MNTRAVRNKSVSDDFSYYLDDELKDLNNAVGYLNAALDDGNQEVFLLCLRNVVRANGGIELTAESADIGRAALYKMLSEDGNPRFNSLIALLNQLGLKMTLAVA
jgi:probable addiction module antidote protein